MEWNVIHQIREIENAGQRVCSDTVFRLFIALVDDVKKYNEDHVSEGVFDGKSFVKAADKVMTFTINTISENGTALDQVSSIYKKNFEELERALEEKEKELKSIHDSIVKQEVLEEKERQIQNAIKQRNDKQQEYDDLNRNLEEVVQEKKKMESLIEELTRQNENLDELKARYTSFYNAINSAVELESLFDTAVNGKEMGIDTISDHPELQGLNLRAQKADDVKGWVLLVQGRIDNLTKLYQNCLTKINDILKTN